MTTTEKLVTANDLLALSGGGKRYELAHGRLVTMAAAGGKHGQIAITMGGLIWAFVKEKNLGVVMAAEMGFWLGTDPDTVRAPDVAFVATENLPEDGIPDGFCPGPPDLAVEIVSPHDRADEIFEKVNDYLNAGTLLVWVVYPASKLVAEYKSLDESRVLDDTSTLNGGEVLPGFSLPVAQLFDEA